MRIEKEFKELIPPLSDEEFQELEKNCCEYGIRDNLVVAVYPGSDGEVLIDGHNRHEIARKCNLSFTTKRIDFESKEAAMIWMINNQIGRRNLTTYQRAVLALKTKPMLEKQAREKRNETLKQNATVNQKSDEREEFNTTKELAKIAGVSHDTIHKVEVIQQKAPEETKKALNRGEVSINQVYSGIKAAESQTKQQEKAKEIREARQRREEFEHKKHDNMVNFSDIKQDKEDAETLSEDFYEDVIKIGSKILFIESLMREEELKPLLRSMKKVDMDDLMYRFKNYHSIIIRFLKQITEVEMEERK